MKLDMRMEKIKDKLKEEELIKIGGLLYGF